MRPKKRAVLLLGDMEKLGELRFAIETRLGYLVFQAESDAEAARLLLAEQKICALMVGATGEADETTSTVLAVRETVPVMAFGARASGAFLAQIVTRACQPRSILFARLETLLRVFGEFEVLHSVRLSQRRARCAQSQSATAQSSAPSAACSSACSWWASIPASA